MKEFIKENKKTKNLYISIETLNNIIKSFKNELKKQEQVFYEMYKIDNKKCNQVIDIDKILNLLDEYKKEEILNIVEKKIVVALYYGNPYITINLCMQALVNKRAIIAIIEDQMLAINSLIVSIFNRDIRKLQNMSNNKIN